MYVAWTHLASLSYAYFATSSSDSCQRSAWHTCFIVIWTACWLIVVRTTLHHPLTLRSHRLCLAVPHACANGTTAGLLRWPLKVTCVDEGQTKTPDCVMFTLHCPAQHIAQNRQMQQMNCCLGCLLSARHAVLALTHTYLHIPPY